MPSAEGAVAVPTSMTLPAVTSLLPLNSVELYDESPQHRVPGVSGAGSKIVPLYRARGYYGPNPMEFDDQEYDLAPPPEPSDNTYLPTAFSDPPVASAPKYPSKKVKIIKVNGEPPRKKAPRKPKSKQRAVQRAKPQPQDDEHPVSNFHEQFYSDLDGSGTIRKIRRPHRVEKIIDGDTEHIHTYSEEHIHKLFYDDGRVDPVVGSMSTLAGHSHPLIRFKNSQTLLAYPPDNLAGLSVLGSMGTPSHLEYTAYNPREVTHDHIFHDHGEIPSDVDVTREQMSFPPRVSYNSQGIRVGGVDQKVYKKYPKPHKSSVPTDYSYYESMYSPYSKPRAVPRPTNPTSFYPTEQSLDDYRPNPLIPSFKLKDKGNVKTRNSASVQYFGNGKQVSDYSLHQASVPAPFAVSSTVVHDYKPKVYAGTSAALQTRPFGLNKFKDPLRNFKDNSYTNNYDFDSFASSSDLYTAEDNNNSPAPIFHGKKGKKKSVSTQNISFGGLDHQTTVDHLGGSGFPFTPNIGSSLNLDPYNNFDPNKGIDSATSTPYTIRESSPAHPYYTAMALEALQSDPLSVGEASNDNFQYAEAPPPSTTHTPSVATTTSPPLEDYFLEIETTEPVPTEPTEYLIDTRQRHRQKETSLSATSTHKDTKQKYSVLDLLEKDYKSADRPVAPTLTVLHHATKYSYKHGTDMPRSSGSLKYGDRI